MPVKLGVSRFAFPGSIDKNPIHGESMKANVKIKDGRVLMILDLPLDQTSLDKVAVILGLVGLGKAPRTHKYSKLVSDNPTHALADMFAYVERQGIAVTDVYFPRVAQPVIEALKGFEMGELWRARCTYDRDDNGILVVGEGIEVRGSWE